MFADVINANREDGGDSVKRVAEFGGMKCTANPQFAQTFILQADAGVMVSSYFGQYVVETAVAEHQVTLPPAVRPATS